MKKNFFLLFVFIIIISCTSKPIPPKAKILPDTTFIHDVQLIDNYAWLKDKTRSNPEVLEYINAENKYAKKMMRHTKKNQKKLFKEMVNRLSETDLSVPVKIDDFFYYSRREKDDQYYIYCRKKGSLDAEEEVYLDVNKLAKGHDYFSIAQIKLSSNHRFVAYLTDITGAEKYSLHIKNIETGEYFEDTISSVWDLTWANDNKTIFYSAEDKAGRSYQIYRHILGTDTKNDKLIFTEKDEKFWSWVSKSNNKKYIILGTASKTTTECWFLSADKPLEEFKIITPRQPGHDYYVLPHEDEFYIITNDNAKNNKLMKTPVSNPSKENWKEVIAHRDSVRIDADIFKEYLAIIELSNGLEKLRIFEINTGKSFYVDFPEPIYSFYTWRTAFDSPVLRYTYESLVTPYSVFDYNMITKERKLKKEQEILGGFDSANYCSERIFAIADDGEKIPISLVYKKDKFKRNGENPLLLTGYGAYGDSSDPYFSSARLSLLDRGFIFAIAHVRGGKEMGETWYEQGKMLNKKNTFTDFIVCAEHLISEKFTNANKLVIDGGSAGGLLVGAVTNMRPDLFKGVIADVPFVDVLNTMFDPALSAVVSEYEEWGDPNIKEYFDYIFSYSPYDNIQAKDYPNILVLAGFNDPRVNYWEPAKWTAKLRANKTDDNLLLLYTNMSAGHGGASGRYDYYEEIALTYAFILDILGIE